MFTEILGTHLYTVFFKTSPNFVTCLFQISALQRNDFLHCQFAFKSLGTLKSVTHILQWWNLAQLYLTWKFLRHMYINHVTYPLSSAEINIFSPEIVNFSYINKYRLHFNIVSNSFNFLESLIKVVLIKWLQFWYCQQNWLP